MKQSIDLNTLSFLLLASLDRKKVRCAFIEQSKNKIEAKIFLKDKPRKISFKCKL